MDWISSVFSSPASPPASPSSSAAPRPRTAAPRETGSLRSTNIRTSSLNHSPRRNSSTVPNNRSQLSQTQSSIGAEICTCNDLIDSVLTYIKNNYGSQFDPYTSDDKVPINLGNWASFLITESIITGCSSIARAGSFSIKAHHNESITISGLLKFNDLVAEFKFDSKFGKLGYRLPLRNKYLHIWVTQIVVNIEILVNPRGKTVKISTFNIISIESLDGKSGGLSWPMNKIADTILRHQLISWKSHCNESAEQLKHMINDASGQYLGDIFSHFNFTDIIDKI